MFKVKDGIRINLDTVSIRHNLSTDVFDFTKGITLPATGKLTLGDRGSIQAPGDGNLLLLNNAGSDFGLIQLGGTTNAFPAVKRQGTALYFRLADDSGWASVAASNYLFGANGTRINTSGNGIIALYNNGATDFNRLQLGGITSAFPAIKRSSSTIAITLADDSDYTILDAKAIYLSGGGQGYWSSSSFRSKATSDIGWSGTGNASETTDVSLWREGIGILAQRVGTAAQAFRIYGTYTDATNYERAMVGWNSTTFEVGTEKSGTGASRNLRLKATADLSFNTNAADRWYIVGSTGHFLAVTDNSHDIGQTSANRPRNIYAAAAIQAGSWLQAGTSASISFNGRSGLTCAADGDLRMCNNAGTDFRKLQFGGISNAFPAIKRSGTELEVKLADDSGPARISALNLQSWRLTRTLPTAVNDCVDIGTFSLLHGSYNLDIALSVNVSGFTRVKRYTLVAQWGATSTDTWMVAAPLVDAGHVSSQNFQLEVNMAAADLQLRVRRLNGSISAPLHVVIVNNGNIAATLTNSTAETVAAPVVTTILPASTISSLHVTNDSSSPRLSYHGSFTAGTFISAPYLNTDATGYLSFGNRSRIYSDADGSMRISNAAGSDFTILQFGGTTSSFPALKRATNHLRVRLADDSDAANLSVNALYLRNGQFLSSTGTEHIILNQSSGGGFGRLIFGGSTTSFPSIKRSGAGLQIRLGDDSGFTSLETGRLILQPSTSSFVPLNIPQGATPSAPINGDVWTTSSGLYVQINGATLGPLGTGSGSGMVGPSPSTDNAIPRFDGAGGSTLKDSSVILGDGGDITVPGVGGYFQVGSTIRVASSRISLGSNCDIAWGATNSATATKDTNLARTGVGKLGQLNGTTAQTFEVYNTYTDASNYERAVISFSHTLNALVIGTEAAGTGGTRTLGFMTNGVRRWYVHATNGHLLASSDTLYDIGSSTGAKPRDFYAGRNIFADGYVLSGGKVEAGGSSLLGFFGRSSIESPADGNVALYNNAKNDFGLLQFGGTTSAFPALKRNGTAIEVRTADDSGFTNLRALQYLFSAGTRLAAPADGQLTLFNATSSDFSLLQFGGTTSAFPAIKKTSNGIQFKLADDSLLTWIQVSRVSLGYGSRLLDTVDGIICITNNAQNDFGRLQLGGTTSAFPAIKRSGTTIAFRLANDSDDTDITAKGITLSGSLLLPASTTVKAPLTITPGVDPTAPNNGDIWTTSDNIFARLDGQTISLKGGGEVPRGVPAGLTLINSVTDPNSHIVITVGSAATSDNAELVQLTSPLSKSLNATWVAGDDNGGLDTGVKQVKKGYHVFAILNPTTKVTDGLYSLSAANPVLPSGYTKFRRLGTVLTDGSGNIVLFHQIGCWFYLRVPYTYSFTNADANTAYVRKFTGLPEGRSLQVKLTLAVTGGTGAGPLFSQLSSAVFAAPTTATWGQVVRRSLNNGYAECVVPTDASAQVYSITNDTTDEILTINVLGWFDDLTDYN